MVIREIKASDAEAFWQMQFELDKETKYMLYEPNERTKNIDLINSLIQKAINGEGLLLVAENDEDIVGFIGAKRGALNRIKHSAYIVVGVRKDFQGRGIGTEFFKKLNLWAYQNDITRLELTVVCENTRAKHLYDNNGFVVEGIKKNSMVVDGKYVDEYCMAKLLSNS